MGVLRFAVCPHDTVSNLEGWYRLAQYLSQRLNTSVQFEMAMDFDDFHEQMLTADLVYANPSDFFKLQAERNFQALARPSGCYDEAVFIAHTGIAQPSLSQIQGEQLALVEGLLPTRVALKMLAGQGISPGRLRNCGSWTGVVSCVCNGESPFGIVYKDAYDNLSEQSKAMVQLIAASNEHMAFHTFSTGATAAPYADRLRDLLPGMRSDPVGSEVLGDMHLTGWELVSAAELEAMSKLVVA